MSPTGISRRIDHLGRIVLPVEFRRALGIVAGDLVAMSLADGHVRLEKVEAVCTFCGSSADLRSYRSKRVCATCAAELGNIQSRTAIS